MTVVPVLVLISVFIAVISILWTNFIGAPWVPTSMRTVRTMLVLADAGPEDIVYDLGCGDGRMIVTAARRCGAKAVGIEIDPFRYLWCRSLVDILDLRGRVEVVYGNFFAQDLSAATVVTCFLLQDTNDKLENKLLRELRPGTRVVSNLFTFKRLRLVREDGDARLYTIPARAANQQ